MKKFLTIAGVLAVIATPAFAQSSKASKLTAQTTQSMGYQANDMVPDRYSPILNGGGSEGYNQAVDHGSQY
jgi:hypothetical protein